MLHRAEELQIAVLSNSWPVRWGVPAQPSSPLAWPLSQFEPIQLAEMDNVALQDRTDTKYAMTLRQWLSVLPRLRDHYRVLDIDGVRLSAYQTLYFDTPGFTFYRRHQAGRPERCKVRSRRYLDSGQAFLEVKFKTRQDRTLKRRLPTRGIVTRRTPELEAFLSTCLPQGVPPLEPKLWNEFSRITLVSQGRPERLTIDLNVRFFHDQDAVALPGVVVAEVKQAGRQRASEFIRLMQADHIRPTAFSKYCVGVALLFPSVPHNHFKPLLGLVNKLMREENYADWIH